MMTDSGDSAIVLGMRRAEVIDRLRKHRAEFVRLGIAHMRLFGSVARDQADEQSDIDLVVDSPTGEPLGLFKLIGVSDAVERILGRPADVFSQAGLNHTEKMRAR